jgi:hypothetical protein
VTGSIPGYKFELGKGALLRDGSDVTIFATGLMVQKALTAVDQLKAQGISARLIDIHTIKPLDEEIVLKAAKETGAFVTAEEHNIIGGLGGAICELASTKVCPVPVERVGVEGCIRPFRQCGSAAGEVRTCFREYRGSSQRCHCEEKRLRKKKKISRSEKRSQPVSETAGFFSGYFRLIAGISPHINSGTDFCIFWRAFLSLF